MYWKAVWVVMLFATLIVGGNLYLKSMRATFLEADCKVLVFEVMDNLGAENRQAPDPSEVIARVSQYSNNSCDIVGYEVRKAAPSELELRFGSKVHRWRFSLQQK